IESKYKHITDIKMIVNGGSEK
ncbi:MAG: hypothetical protein K0R90_1571, partial [Oscillospiraceae bacterium]|nr:hypothetical protein [Oscillospiraceae bacterium]